MGLNAPEVPLWVEHAACLPIAFAQVREDPLLDLRVVDRLAGAAGRGCAVEVVMIASGGCTAALLASSPRVGRIHVVDPNPAQIALCRLKCRLMEHAEPGTRLALLGHAPLSASRRETDLRRELDALGLLPEALGSIAFVSEVGPDHAGRYEAVFAALQRTLRPWAEEIQALLALDDPLEQSRRVGPTSHLGQVMDQAFDDVLSLRNLVALFGTEATKNPVKPFSRHFAERTRHALGSMPANSNPYLGQMLRGRAPQGCAAPWLNAPGPSALPELEFTVGTMSDALEAMAPASVDFVHLSNILDWLGPTEAGRVLELAWRALRPGGLTLIRQLNSSLDVRSSTERLEWLGDESEAMHRDDRSFFYRALHLGRKP